MFEVVYFSRTGNTRKVAEAIAGELNVTAKDVGSAGVLPPDAFIFLGTGCYGAALPKEISLFTRKNRFNGRKIALFTTSGFGSLSERAVIEKQLRGKGAVITHNFRCYGRFLAVKKDHPTPQELENARSFARAVAVTMFPERGERAKIAGAAR